MIVAAFYFPQFYADPTLEQWFGPRGSDWENVRSALSRHCGHRVLTPGELGEYDTADPSVRVAQRNLALSHGIDSFCYYHYWSDGKRLLDVVERSIFAGALDAEMPFFLCWANHDWYRALAGGGKESLRPQSYSARHFGEHAAYLRSMFAHPAYLTIDGRPVMLVYEPLASSEIASWARELRAHSLISPLLLGVEWCPTDREKILRNGFDGTIAQIPHFSRMKLPGGLHRAVARTEMEDVVIDVEQLDRYLDDTDDLAWKNVRDRRYRIPTTYVGWDNSPRRHSGATLVIGNDPEQFRVRIARMLRTAQNRFQPLALVNAWNEWGEGCALEPSGEFGREFLRVVRSERASIVTS